MRLKLLLSRAILTVVLVACTPPSPPGTPAPPPGPETPEPSVPTAQAAFTSHADGAQVYGEREITVQVSLTDAEPDASITVESNARSVTYDRSADLLEIVVVLKDHANELTVTLSNPGQEAPAASVSLGLDFPFLTLTNAQAAAVVIGQPDFDTNSESDPTKQLYSVYQKPLVLHGVLYLPDWGDAKVMGYLQVPTTNGAAADFLLGKQSFEDGIPPDGSAGPASNRGPHTVASDGQRLFIVDYSWHRITVHDTPPTISGATADHVIGQPDFFSVGPGTSSTRFTEPESLAVVDGKLIVADSGNNRILIWDTVPTDGATPADLVLGQPDMESSRPNAGGNVAANTLDLPTDVWSDGTRLAVADQNNNRVLIWNTFPTEDFAPADIVIGQPDALTNDFDVGQDKFYAPSSLHSNGNQLFVADSYNSRVLVWNSFPTATGQPADVVLGQPDFDGDLEGLSSTRLNTPTGVYGHGNRLFVADNANDRYLVFHGANH